MLRLNGCCWLWGPCSSPGHPVGRIVVLQWRGESQQLGDQLTVRTGRQSHTMPHELLRHKPKVLPALKKQSHITLWDLNLTTPWCNGQMFYSASGDQSIIMPSFFQQTNYVKWGGTIFYASTTFFSFSSHSFALHATKINATNIQGINSCLGYLIGFVNALGRDVKHRRENMKLPITDPERYIKAESPSQDIFPPKWSILIRVLFHYPKQFGIKEKSQ